MCCDGTLFLHAHLNAGERGNLPEQIEGQSYSKDGKDYFRLPCGYFRGKCSIYDQKKADVCSAYRCQLLKDFSAATIDIDYAFATVGAAIEMRKGIMEEYSNLTGDHEDIYFKKLLRELGKLQESVTEERTLPEEYELLLAHCNIFEALLIKHFRPADEFENIMVRLVDEEEK